MTHVKYWVVEEDEEVEETKYSNILQEEDFEEEDPPEGFEGLQKGSNITEEENSDYTGPVPWDPSEIFFVYI
jgi:hypothetical protein